MRLQIHYLVLLMVVALLSWGCNHPPKTDPQGVPTDSLVYEALPKPCGVPELVDVRGESNHSIGVFEVMNDSTHLYLTYSPPPGYTIDEISIYYGREKDLPFDDKGIPDAAAFPLSYKNVNVDHPWTARIAWIQLPYCLFVSSKVKISDAKGSQEGWAASMKDSLEYYGLRYCRQACRVQASECTLDQSAKQPVTMMQDQWTSDAGILAKNLLTKNFATMFPEGLVIGCDEKAVLNSAETVLRAMPQMGPAAPLLSSPSPGTMPNNRLAGELVSLMLILKLDQDRPEFSPGSPSLAQLQVATGAFEGWGVDEVANEANRVLGGCTSSYTAAQIFEVVQDINQSFAQGRFNRSFLRCAVQ